MRFLIIGLGSMGKRRVRNLQALKAGHVIGYDVREDRRREAAEKYGVLAVDRFEDGMASNPDVVIISTPPHLHIEYAYAAISARKAVFTEFSCPKDPGELYRLGEACRLAGVLGGPSCTMRFHPSVKVIRDVISQGKIGRPLGLVYHSGIYLGDWHPWEDYRSFYVASKEMGGGREQVMFELDWIRWVLGEIKTVSALVRKLSSLEIDSFDFYQMLLEFEGGMVGNVLVDLLQRVPNRHCRILGEEGLILWDWRERQVRVYTAKEATWREYQEGGFAGYSVEQMYVDELAHFLEAVHGKTAYLHTYSEERRVLELVYAAERSSETNSHVNMGLIQ